MSAITLSTVTRIRQLASELDQLGKTALEKAIEAGQLLSEAKETLPHGQWLPWLEENFSFTDRTAQRWMKLADDHAAGRIKSDSVSYLSEAYQVTTTPRATAIAPTPSKAPAPSAHDEQPPLVIDGTKAQPHVSNNSGDNEWYTPVQFIQSARAVMGEIDLDPASCTIANKTVGASVFHDKEQDGLTQQWNGRVWMNPPYAQPLIQQFADKLVAEVKRRNVSQAIALVNNATETEWFQRMAGSAAAICFPKSRVRFLDPEGKPGAPLQGQAILYFGNRAQRFIDEFENHGQCVAVVKPLTGGPKQ